MLSLFLRSFLFRFFVGVVGVVDIVGVVGL